MSSQGSTAPQVITTGYEPRDQQLLIHRSLKRFNVLVCHRRFGKTVLCINALIDAALRCEKTDPRFAYIAPLFNQAKDIAWSYLKQYAMVIPGAQAHESELRVDLPGGRRIRLYGADNPDRLRGLYFDGVVLDEFADMDPRVWSEVVRPALSDRLGWAIFIGTPKGRNEFWRLYDEAGRDERWYAAMFRASETGIVPPLELADARKSMTPDQYEQEYECSFQAAIQGAYYGKDMSEADAAGRITSVPYERSVAVHTAWDLGVSDSTAIWFAQQVGKEIRIIDYYEASGEGLDHYAKVLSGKPYSYGNHYLPHDVKVRELGTGKSRVETLASLGIKAIIVADHSREDGINAVRMMLNRCWFDEEKTARGLECLRQYRREWDDKLKAFKRNPLHDWASNGADSFRYLAMGLKAQQKRSAIPYKPLPNLA